MKYRLVMGLIGILMFTFLPGMAFAGAFNTIIGTVTESYTIETEDGMVFEIGDTDQGMDLAEHVGKKVQVTGEMEEEGDLFVIYVDSFKVLEE